MSDSHSGDGAPPLCRNGCGFFGNAATLSMCSKCYSDHMRAQEAQRVPAGPSSESPAVAASPASTSAPAMPSVAASPAPAASPALCAPCSPAVGTGVASPAAAVAAGGAAAERPVQANTSRCWTCNKKIGLTGFKCRCEYFFCSTHRYSDMHACNFDYKEMGRDALTKANPTVVADKIERI
mmetsp:Transcript_14130/g.46415  ORF Transcript_14130/g.46415 Transcript_14130/m.46415 type:complete len:181 (+) Transcript_14130:76-618(+)